MRWKINDEYVFKFNRKYLENVNLSINKMALNVTNSVKKAAHILNLNNKHMKRNL